MRYQDQSCMEIRVFGRVFRAFPGVLASLGHGYTPQWANGAGRLANAWRLGMDGTWKRARIAPGPDGVMCGGSIGPETTVHRFVG